jgi:hypothetical protein
MHPRAASLIQRLALAPHPEGGYYREVHRSAERVHPLDGRTERVAITTIYFLLPAGEISRWHRVASDEVWYFFEGDPLELLIVNRGFDRLQRLRLGPVGESSEPQRVVEANEWQAARSTGAYTLVGCAVGPGFEFADFEMLRDLPAGVALARQRAEIAVFI